MDEAERHSTDQRRQGDSKVRTLAQDQGRSHRRDGEQPGRQTAEQNVGEGGTEQPVDVVQVVTEHGNADTQGDADEHRQKTDGDHESAASLTRYASHVATSTTGSSSALIANHFICRRTRLSPAADPRHDPRDRTDQQQEQEASDPNPSISLTQPGVDTGGSLAIWSGALP